jgi:hypothetical protein
MKPSSTAWRKKPSSGSKNPSMLYRPGRG